MSDWENAEAAGREVERQYGKRPGRVYVFVDWGDVTAPACGSGAFLSDAVTRFRWVDKPFNAIVGTDRENGGAA